MNRFRRKIEALPLGVRVLHDLAVSFLSVLFIFWLMNTLPVWIAGAEQDFDLGWPVAQAGVASIAMTLHGLAKERWSKRRVRLVTGMVGCVFALMMYAAWVGAARAIPTDRLMPSTVSAWFAVVLIPLLFAAGLAWCVHAYEQLEDGDPFP